MLPVYFPGAAQFARTVAMRGLNCSNQDSTGGVFRFSDDIQTPVHAINEINIGIAWRSKHDFTALGLASEGVTGGVVLSVGLDLQDAPGEDATAIKTAAED